MREIADACGWQVEWHDHARLPQGGLRRLERFPHRTRSRPRTRPQKRAHRESERALPRTGKPPGSDGCDCEAAAEGCGRLLRLGRSRPDKPPCQSPDRSAHYHLLRPRRLLCHRHLICCPHIENRHHLPAGRPLPLPERRCLPCNGQGPGALRDLQRRHARYMPDARSLRPCATAAAG